MAYALLFNPITIHFARKEKAALLEEFNPPGARKNSTTCGTLILEEGKKEPLPSLKWERRTGTPSGARTLDTLIKSQVLYQLS